MDRITLQNYRCFGSEEQSARLAPLTLLVGPNSTGKTSFLALIRALWDVAFREVVPNFREHPYDLGSWDDIVYRRGGREKSADEFAGGFDFHTATDQFDGNIGFSAAFSNLRSAPYPATRSYYRADYSFTARDIEPGSETQLVTRIGRNGRISNLESRFSGFAALQFLAFESEPVDLAGVEDSTTRDDVVTAGLNRLFDTVRLFPRSVAARPFAGAPIGSRPQRTFDPALIAQDAGGDYIPSYLANLYRRNADEWRSLKDALEKFGTASELFDEIHVRSLGNADGDPFQLQVRKHSGPISRRRKGPWRNLIDVGYGVSQALPVLTELLRPDNPKMFLLQQPEVHLHPQAQRRWARCSATLRPAGGS